VSAYKTAAAFREALKARLRALAKDGPWEPQQLQRQLAYDRLLERLYLADDGWIVKGAVALLARDIGVRASLDIDVYRASTTDAAESDLRTAAKRDVGDWFRFDVGPRGPVADGAAGLRLPVIAYVGATQWCAEQLLRLRRAKPPTNPPTPSRIASPQSHPPPVFPMRGLEDQGASPRITGAQRSCWLAGLFWFERLSLLGSAFAHVSSRPPTKPPTAGAIQQRRRRCQGAARRNRAVTYARLLQV
jgi:hypothetical protein